MFSYKKTGEGKEVILLHGWGSTKETFDDVCNHLKEDFTCYQIDLPGFGESKIEKSMSLDDYTDLLREFILEQNIKNPIILGHSFGGRIAINYASAYEVDKLILVDSAGIRRFNLKVYLKIRCYKLFKKFNIKNNFGSIDYKKSNYILKGTMNKIVPIDLRKKMKMIKSETLILWGSLDETTPLKDGKEINKLISNSVLITIPKTSHFPYLENHRYFMLMLNSFLVSDNS
ncbi:MAG: alpha/beta hydrolase [bacterium]